VFRAAGKVNGISMPVGHKLFRFELVTPERPLPAVQCTFAVLPAWDGEVGVLAGRSPLVCKLGAGELRLEVEAGPGRWQRFYVRGGFARVMPDGVTVLTEEVVPAGELSAQAAQRQLSEAKDLPADTEQAGAVRQAKIEQAKAQLHIIAKRDEE